jgi:hypothetical protein
LGDNPVVHFFDLIRSELAEIRTLRRLMRQKRYDEALDHYQQYYTHAHADIAEGSLEKADRWICKSQFPVSVKREKNKYYKNKE